jgi:PAS domain S-box-containing protein
MDNSRRTEDAGEKGREQTLTERSLLQAIVEGSGDAIYVKDLEGRYLFVNSATARLLDKPPSQIVGQSDHTLFPSAEATRMVAADQSARKGLVTLDEVVTLADGAQSTFLTIKGPVHDAQGNLRGIFGIARDITQRKQVEQQLRESVARVRGITESVADTVLLADRTGRITFANRLQAGLQLGQVLSATVFDFVPPEQRPVVEQAMVTVFEHRQLTRYESLGPGPEGTVCCYDVTVGPVTTGEGEVVAAVFVARDITARTNLEKDLRQARVAAEEREREYGRLVEKLNEAQRIARIGSWEMDVRTGAVWWSDEVYRIFGVASDFVPSLDSNRRFFHPDDIESFERRFQASIDTGTPLDCTLRLLLADGTIKHCYARAEVTRDTAGRPLRFAGIVMDVSEQRRLEEERERLRGELFQAQKMEAIGTLAGGVAHDFNNILGGVLGSLSLLELDLENDPGRRDEVRAIEGMVRRGADLAKQLLGFARGGKYEVKPLDLAKVVSSTSTMFARTRRELSITLSFAADLPAVLMDHTQLEQVLLNLLLNAGQAMSMGGTIVLAASPRQVDAQEAERHQILPGRYVELCIGDTGEGMDEATRARIFEPFFTTKGPGKGSGLGLASVYGIIKHHKGGISVESTLGKGTTFTLLLPATDQTVEDRPTKESSVVRGQGTVLVVDDEAAMLSVCQRMMGQMGYDVIAVSSGEAALEQVRKLRPRLVILDLTMPGMSGASTFTAMHELAPEIPVLLSSGYSVDGQAQTLLAAGCRGFLQKPYSIHELSARVREILGDQSQSPALRG